ncbi:MAG: MarR family transcriptional regulator [Melioribacteraceae bacterium]|nr:MarR family transcriptional regulator [Melioribacteraceae bacterium]
MNKAEELLITIQGIAKKIREIKEKELASAELQDFSMASFRYIEEIHNLKNPTFVELTNKLNYSKPTVTLMVAKLIEKGFVTKTKSKGDGRVYYLGLSAKGEKIIESYNKVYSSFINEISSRYDSKEMDTLISLLKRM